MRRVRKVEREPQSRREGMGMMLQTRPGASLSMTLSRSPLGEAGRRRFEEEAGAGEEGADPAEPEIKEHPRSATVTRGDPAEFRAAARGEQPLRFQWLHDGRELEGKTEPELAFLEVEPRHAGMYSCRVSNAHGEVVTRAARLEVQAGGAGDTAVEDFEEDGVEEFVAE